MYMDGNTVLTRTAQPQDGVGKNVLWSFGGDSVSPSFLAFFKASAVTPGPSWHREEGASLAVPPFKPLVG